MMVKSASLGGDLCVENRVIFMQLLKYLLRLQGRYVLGHAPSINSLLIAWSASPAGSLIKEA